MLTMTATAASRGFSALLDAVSNGETIQITRGGRAVAELRPPERHTVGELRRRLATTPRLDAEFAADVAAMAALVTAPEIPWPAE